MSKKNLSRSAIEGGRRYRNSWDRNQSHRDERAISREYCGRALTDDEYFDHRVIEKRPVVYQEFNDKLGPMYRWLRSKVGKPWSQSRSEAHKMYDTRTTAGRHILYDHLLSSVSEKGAMDFYSRYNDFVVDENGILQLAEDNRWNRRANNRARNAAKYPGDWADVSQATLYAWAGQRKVIDYGAVQYWTAEPTRVSWRVCRHTQGYYGGSHYCNYYPSKRVDVTHRAYNREAQDWISKVVNELHCYSPDSPSYRQGIKLNKKEAEFWRKLHPVKKALVLFETSAQAQKRVDERNKRYKRSIK